MSYISDIDPQQFFKELQIASKHNIPVIFYTWFGPGCAVSTWQDPDYPQEQKNWTSVTGPIELFKDGITDSDEKSKLDNKDFINTAQVLKCAPCYQTIIDLHKLGCKTLTSVSQLSEHLSSVSQSSSSAQSKSKGALVYFAAWSSVSDAEVAKKKWVTNYKLDMPYVFGKTNRVPFIWFGDLIDSAAATSEKQQVCLEPQHIEDFRYLKALESSASDHESDTVKELRRNLKRASGAGDLPHHTSAVITGKEILALLLRRFFGGVTADTTVLPCWVGNKYDSRAAPKTGERYLHGDIADEKSWQLVNRQDPNDRVTSSIANGLQKLFKREYSSGPTQHRNTGGVVYEGQPRDVTTETGYVVKENFKALNKIIPVVLTYDFKTIEGDFYRLQEKDKQLLNADLIDVFCNYTPYSKKDCADSALKLFLVGMMGMREGENENLLTYNAFRGPATLSAAMTEYVTSQIKEDAHFEERHLRGFGRTLAKTGRVVDVTYYRSLKNNLPILGYGESRNPTPDQMRQGGKRRDIIGKDGYMLLLELNLVKIWSGTWKASTEFTVPVTPRDLSSESSFSDEFSDEDSSDDSPGNDDKGKNDMSDVGYSDGESSTDEKSEQGTGDLSCAPNIVKTQPEATDETTYGALKRKRADPEPESESHGKFLEPVTTDN